MKYKCLKVRDKKIVLFEEANFLYLTFKHLYFIISNHYGSRKIFT